MTFGLAWRFYRNRLDRLRLDRLPASLDRPLQSVAKGLAHWADRRHSELWGFKRQRGDGSSQPGRKWQSR